MICYRPEEAASLLRAVRGRTGHLLDCSTVDVYARPARTYPSRTTTRWAGSAPTARPSWLASKCCSPPTRRGAVPVTLLRPAQTYGEGRDLIHVFGRDAGVWKRLRRGQPVIVHGDGSSLWVACHIDDVARAFAGAAGNAAAFGAEERFRGTWAATGVAPTTVVSDHLQPHIHAVNAVLPDAAHVRTGLHRAHGEGTGLASMRWDGVTIRVTLSPRGRASATGRGRPSAARPISWERATRYPLRPPAVGSGGIS